MKYKIEYLRSQPFAYMRREGAYGKENYELMERFKCFAKVAGYLTSETIIYGIARDDPATTAPSKCRYDVGMIVGEEFSDSRLELDTIVEGKYLFFEIPHTAEQVQFFWEHFYRIVADNHYFIDNARPILEMYPLTLIEKGFCTFCIPIE